MDQGKEFPENQQDLSLYNIATRDFVHHPRDSVSPMTTRATTRPTASGSASEPSLESGATRAKQGGSKVPSSTTYYTRTHASRGRRRIPQTRASLTYLPLSLDQNGVTNLISPSAKEWTEARVNSGFPLVSASEGARERFRRAYALAIATATSPEASTAVEEDEDEDEDEESSVSER